MKLAVATLAFVLAAAVGSAFAAETAKPMTAQQSKMSTCSKDAHAKGLKGDEYKSFMSTCLKGGEAAAPAAAKPAVAATPATAKETQQEKMKTCNAEAKTKALKGAARKTFMSTCLKGEHEAAPAAH